MFWLTLVTREPLLWLSMILWVSLAMFYVCQSLWFFCNCFIAKWRISVWWFSRSEVFVTFIQPELQTAILAYFSSILTYIKETF